MPQHSKASWVQTLSKNREPYDDLQKKAAIQHRKMLAQKQAEELLVQQQAQRQQVLSHKHADPSGSSHSTTPAEALPEPPGSPPPPPPSTIPPDFASNEFKAITISLANGIADGRSDDDVWLAMSQEVGRQFLILRSEGILMSISIRTVLLEVGEIIGICILSGYSLKSSVECTQILSSCHLCFIIIYGYLSCSLLLGIVMLPYCTMLCVYFLTCFMLLGDVSGGLHRRIKPSVQD